MTSYAIELAKHDSWQRQAEFADSPWPELLVRNEFLSTQEQQSDQNSRLSYVIRFAVQHCPYYGKQFNQLGLDSHAIRSVQELTRVAILTKQTLHDEFEQLRACSLPPGDQLFGMCSSSGTTGRPVKVLISRATCAMFSLLWLRQARWFGLDPRGTMLDVRIPSEVADSGCQPNPDGNLVSWKRWRYLGKMLETGPEFGFNLSDSLDRQLDWLKVLQPNYAMSAPGIFEEWSSATGGQTPVESLRCLICIGAQLTPSLRERLERIYKIPIHQTYGLNEIGKVALRCEAGRYHVHAEYCIVEIVDDDGCASTPGTVGRLLVTALQNLAMPLIRYDTGDLAEAVVGPCACGRSSPSFGEIAGRFRRFVGLPAATRSKVNALNYALDEAPTEIIQCVRQHQISQNRKNEFELRIRVDGAIPEIFYKYVNEAWKPVAGDPPSPLKIVRVPSMPATASGKVLDFVSEFYVDDYAAAIE